MFYFDYTKYLNFNEERHSSFFLLTNEFMLSIFLIEARHFEKTMKKIFSTNVQINAILI